MRGDVSQCAKPLAMATNVGKDMAHCRREQGQNSLHGFCTTSAVQDVIRSCKIVQDDANRREGEREIIEGIQRGGWWARQGLNL
jgi:hypothetical protein